jgi:hypothetical protein
MFEGLLSVLLAGSSGSVGRLFIGSVLSFSVLFVLGVSGSLLLVSVLFSGVSGSFAVLLLGVTFSGVLLATF